MKNDYRPTPVYGSPNLTKAEGVGCAAGGCGIILLGLAIWALKIAAIVFVIALVLHWLGIVSVPLFALAVLA